jgi:ribonuclease HI
VALGGVGLLRFGLADAGWQRPVWGLGDLSGLVSLPGEDRAGLSGLQAAGAFREEAGSVWGAFLHVFSDGSFGVDALRGGVGVVAPALGFCRGYHLGAIPSAYVAELVGLALGLAWLEEVGADRGVVFCDCLSALQAVRLGCCGAVVRDPLVWEVVGALWGSLRAGRDFRIAWVPGHVGVAGCAAKAAAASPRSFPVRVFLQPGALSGVLRREAWAAWNVRWAGMAEGARYREVHGSAARGGVTYGLGRWGEAVLFRLSCGHVPLRAHLARLRCVPSPLCACGVGEETVGHFLFACVRFARAREGLLRGLRAAGVAPAWPGCLRSDCPRRVARLVLSFVKASARLRP